jgi:hypothetical protein
VSRSSDYFRSSGLGCSPCLRARVPGSLLCLDGVVSWWPTFALSITRSTDVPILCAPPPIFKVVLQTKHFRNSTLGRPLRGAWVALGWPKGHPIPNPIPVSRGSQPGSPQVPSTKYQLPSFLANCRCQLLSAIFSMIRPTSTPEGCGILADFPQRINCESGQREIRRMANRNCSSIM